MLEVAYHETLSILRDAEAKIVIEDDYADFKNFFVDWKEPQLDGTCSTVAFVLMETHAQSGSSDYIEFHCHLYTSKHRKKQRQLGDNDFYRVKDFLDSQVSTPCGFQVVEYFKTRRDYKTSRMSHLFINNEPGVIIEVGGLLNTNSRKNNG